MDPEFLNKIETLADSRGRYRPEAYFWVMRVLEFTRRRLQREGHISGRELLEGARLLALDEYGPMSYDVLRHWGIERTEDVGRIVFDLVEEGILRTTEEDTIEDFTDIYDLREVFVRNYPW